MIIDHIFRLPIPFFIWVFQIPPRRDFAPGFTALFSTIGALRAPSFTSVGGKIQTTRYARGRWLDARTPELRKSAFV
jgi:hypothetical protein